MANFSYAVTRCNHCDSIDKMGEAFEKRTASDLQFPSKTPVAKHSNAKNEDDNQMAVARTG